MESNHPRQDAPDFSNSARVTKRKGEVALFALLGTVAVLSGPCTAGAEAASSRALKKLSVEELLNVEMEVTSVSRRPEKLWEAASAIQVIAEDDIRRSGASSLPEALRLASNLEVAQINSRSWAISARGLNTSSANQLLVLMDGRSLYAPRLGGVLWDVQDTLLEDISQIEVISGPGAALWGANAVNGVINISTKRAQETQGLLVTGAAGTELRDSVGLRYGGTLGSSGFSYRAYAKHLDRDGLIATTGANDRGAWGWNQAGFRADGNLSPRDSLTVQGDFYSGDYEQAAVANSSKADGSNVLARWSRTLSGDADFKLQFFYDRVHRRTPGLIAESLDTYDVDFQHRFPLSSRHSVLWGLGYRLYGNRTYESAGQIYFPPDRTLRTLSGFVQDAITLIDDKLHLTLGTKLEHNDYSGLEWQPSGRIAWIIDPSQTAWSAISRAVRTPARTDTEQYFPSAPPYTRVGNPYFDSEEMLAYELGYRIQPHARVSLSLAGFYNDYDKIRSVELLNPPASSPTFIGNGQQGRSHGAELTLDLRLTDWWRLRLADTEIRIALRPKPGSTDRSFGANESFDPEHQYFARSSFDLPRNLQLDLNFRHVSYIAHQNVPAYSELDLRIGWMATPNLELSLAGQNLLHDEHGEFGSFAMRREIERGLYGKFLWTF